MPDSKIEYLITRYLEDKLLPSEREELTGLLALKENEEVAKEFLSKAWGKSKTLDPIFSEAKSADILQRIITASKADDVVDLKERKLSIKSAIAVAASLIIAVSFGIYFYNSSKESLHSALNVPKQDATPGGNNAVLTLADDTKIYLDKVDNGSLARVGNIIIKKSADGQVIYEVSDSKAEDVAYGYNTISTPNGGQYNIVLPDGSKVWLNSASSLRFPSKFTGDERSVELSGEGYFEVAKNKDKPFRVKAGEANIQVLGTHFNINAYQNEDVLSTTLLEGSVKVVNKGKSVIIKPGQQARLVKGQGGIAFSTVDINDVVAWKSGYFVFNNTDIHSIMRQLARWYNVDVEFKDSNIQETFAGRISKNKNLSEVLKVFETTGTIHFEITPADQAGNGRRVIVMK